MLQNYADYTVEIKDITFRTENFEASRTAIVDFYDKKGKVILTREFACIDIKEVYNTIEKGEPVFLDNCYINNFSLTAYRRTRLMDKKDYVNIKRFSAENAFFDSSYTIDFSFARIEKGEVNFRNTHFASGMLSFNSTHFGIGDKRFEYAVFRDGRVDFANVEFNSGDVSFKNAVFGNGDKDFQYATFGAGTVSFVNGDFGNGDVSFINVIFGRGDAHFKVARFGEGKVDFHFAKFDKGDVSFERAEFGNGKVDFRTVEFGLGKINFNRSVFGDGEVSFEASQIQGGRFTFKKATFGSGNLGFEMVEYDHSELCFDKSDFGSGTISFQKARIRRLSLSSCHLDEYLDLRVSRSEYLDISDTIARDIIDLKPFDSEVDVDTINFTGMRLLGRIYIDWKQNKVLQLIKSQTNTSMLDKAEQFRILKENFNVCGQYNDEDKAYVEFKRYELEVNFNEAISGKWYTKLWEYPWYWTKILIFDKAGLYATNPGRVLFSMVVGYLFFTALYSILLLTHKTDIVSSLGDPDHLTILARSFYHSAITFLTIGYGDYYPSGIVRWISSFEGFAGLFLMSYFTVAFVRKILR